MAKKKTGAAKKPEASAPNKRDGLKRVMFMRNNRRVMAWVDKVTGEEVQG